jgi:hypothetical protein
LDSQTIPLWARFPLSLGQSWATNDLNRLHVGPTLAQIGSTKFARMGHIFSVSQSVLIQECQGLAQLPYILLPFF